MKITDQQDAFGYVIYWMSAKKNSKGKWERKSQRE